MGSATGAASTKGCMNLLTETMESIETSGHEPSQIIFIGSEISGHCCTWDQFKELADKDYDAGFGAAKVADDLKIVFSDGSSMSRREYDGSPEASDGILWRRSTNQSKAERNTPSRPRGGFIFV
jgi:hypothetical protein